MTNSNNEAAKSKSIDITTVDEMNSFLTNVRDKLADGSAAPVYALTALNELLEHPTIYDLLSSENKELARDIWLRVKQAGFQIKNPPLLFDAEDVSPAATR